MPSQKCPSCQTWFNGAACARCDYIGRRKQAKWMVRYYPDHQGAASKPGDSEVRVSRPVPEREPPPNEELQPNDRFFKR